MDLSGAHSAYKSDAFLIVFGVFLLVQSIIIWPVTLLIHAQWIADQYPKGDIVNSEPDWAAHSSTE